MASISEIGRHSPQINFRAPHGLHERLKEAALQNGRSVNAEIVQRLEVSFSANADVAPAIMDTINRYIEAEINTRLKAIATKLAGGGNV